MKRLLFITLVIFISCNNKNTSPTIKDSVISSNQIVRKDSIISDTTNILDSKIQKLELQYIVWGCACANWITPSDYKKYDTSGHLAAQCIFIEPADSTLELPNNFDANKESIKVTGQFYVRKDYPKGTIKMEENLDKAKVFRYTKIEVIKKRKWKNIFDK